MAAHYGGNRYGGSGGNGGNQGSGGAAYHGSNNNSGSNNRAGGPPVQAHSSEVHMKSASVTAGTGRIVKGTHTWKVDGFSLLSINTPRGGYIESARFQCGEHWWTLRLYINGEARSGYDALGIYLHLLPSSTYPPKDGDKQKPAAAAARGKDAKVVDCVDRVSYRFKAVNQFWDAADPNGLHRHFCRPVQTELKYLVNTFKSPDDTWGSENFLRRSHILGEGLAAGGSGGLCYGVSAFSNLVNVSDEWKGFLVSDTLILEAELEYADTVAVASHESGLGFEPLSRSAMLNSLGADMSALFVSGMHSDVEVVVGDGLTSIPAHKSVLAVRSPVFSAMFHHSMAEKQQNSVEIKEFDEAVVLMLLEFVYTGDIGKYTLSKGVGGGIVVGTPPPVSWERASALFQAADKYALDQLTLLCVPLIIETLSPANAMPTLQMLAARPNCAGTPRLLAAAKAFWITNFDAIIPHLNPISAAGGIVSPSKPAAAGSAAPGAYPAATISVGGAEKDSKTPSGGSGGSAASADGPAAPSVATAVVAAGGISNVSHVSRMLAQQPRPYRTVVHASSSTTAPGTTGNGNGGNGAANGGSNPSNAAAAAAAGGGRPSGNVMATPRNSVAVDSGVLTRMRAESDGDAPDEHATAMGGGGFRADSPDSGAEATSLAEAIAGPHHIRGGSGGGAGRGGGNDGSGGSATSSPGTTGHSGSALINQTLGQLLGRRAGDDVGAGGGGGLVGRSAFAQSFYASDPADDENEDGNETP